MFLFFHLFNFGKLDAKVFCVWFSNSKEIPKFDEGFIFNL